MTAVRPAANPADDLVVRPAHLALVLNLSERALNIHIAKGHIPQHEGRGLGGLKLWRLSTIRAWNPDVAAAVEVLLTHPLFAPRPQRHCKTPLLAA